MHIDEIAKEYNLSLEEEKLFTQYIGDNIDDSEDVESIVNEFRDIAKQFFGEQECNETNVTMAEPNPVIEPSVATENNKLISCPDCGKRVSRKATACIHCGCPISGAVELDTYTETALKKVVIPCYKYTSPDYKHKAIKVVQQVMGIDYPVALEIIEKGNSVVANGVDIETAKNIESQFVSAGLSAKIEAADDAAIASDITDISVANIEAPIKCGRCGSTQVATGARGFSIWTGFLGSGKTINRCGKCGYSWQP